MWGLYSHVIRTNTEMFVVYYILDFKFTQMFTILQILLLRTCMSIIANCHQVNFIEILFEIQFIYIWARICFTIVWEVQSKMAFT